MASLCYTYYEVYFVIGMSSEGGDAMSIARKGRWSHDALTTASKGMYLCKQGK